MNNKFSYLRPVFVLLALCLSYSAFSQNTTKIKFSYDDSGNRIKRDTIVVIPGKKAPVAAAQISQNNQQALLDTVSANKAEVSTSDIALVYPNPTYGLININLSAFENGTYQLYDILGKEIQKGVFTSSQTIIDISNEGSGQFILVITANGQNQSFTIMKKS